MSKFLILIFIISLPIQAQDQFHMVYYSDFAPLSWKEDGVMKGAFIDLVDKILVERMGMKVKHTGLPWARAQSMVKAGKADGYFAGPTKTRLEYSSATNFPMYQSPFNLFVKRGHKRFKDFIKVKNLEDLRKIKLGSFLGHGWAQHQLKGYEVKYVKSLDQVLQMIKLERLEMYVGSSLVTNYNIRSIGFEKDIIEIKNTIELVDFHFMVGKKSPFHKDVKILREIEKHFLQLKESGVINKIFEKYQR